MSPPQLTSFQEYIVDLPDGKKLVVDRVVPITSDDYFLIPMPANRTHGSSVVGFLDGGSGGTIAAPNFYTGTTDRVRVQGRAGQNVIVCTLNDGTYRNSIPEIA